MVAAMLRSCFMGGRYSTSGKRFNVIMASGERSHKHLCHTDGCRYKVQNCSYILYT